MRTVTVNERINIRARLAKAGYDSVKFEALNCLLNVKHADVDKARRSRRKVADTFYRASGRSVARFIGWA